MLSVSGFFYFLFSLYELTHQTCCWEPVQLMCMLLINVTSTLDRVCEDGRFSSLNALVAVAAVTASCDIIATILVQ